MFQKSVTISALNQGRSWANIRSLLIENSRDEGRGLVKYESVPESDLNQSKSMVTKQRESFRRY